MLYNILTIIENGQTYKVRIYPDGAKDWYQNGELHRLDGPAVEDSDGYKAWYQNGELHRLDGPAVEEANGSKFWYQNGKRHRLDGPAYEGVNGFKEWWIDDTKYSEDEFNQLLKEKANEIKQLRIKEKLTQPENNRFRSLLE
jgi:hypothetical protein